AEPITGPLATPAATMWSTYHGGPELAGYVETALPEEPEVLWRYQADGPIYFTPVADEHGLYANTRTGQVCALDFQGNERWTRQLMREKGPDGTEKPERLEAPLAAFLSLVIAGATSGKVYALDAATGDVRWSYDLNGTVLGTVNLAPATAPGEPNRLFVINQDDGALHCVDAITGNGLWQADPIDRCDGSAAIGGGSVVFGSCAAALHVFKAADGVLQQNIALDMDSQVASGPALAGTFIYSGSHSGFFYNADAATGRILWINKDSEGEIFSTPAVAPELVVFSCDDGNVYALERRTGARKWTFETDATPTSPVIAGTKVLVGADGVLYIVELETGEKIWSYEISDEIAAPALIEGMVVVGSEDGTVTALGKPAGAG
ncbi:MAG: PQQ-binding-like beta-propeller repeat protein, partial [Candidatus Hydrogenedentes bacterium]|nr:PQQ-binding-like beta-propeller repeat protein [Candidatus Hydrogenedentota bacterium]